MNSENHYTFNYLLIKRKSMLTFHLLKYLNYEDLIRIKFVCKAINNLVDANKVYDDSQLLYLMFIIAL